MILVYLSLALAVVALIYLAVSAAKTFKNLNPTITNLSKTAAGMHKQIEGVQKEADKLVEKANGFNETIIADGKAAVRSVWDEVQEGMDEIGSLVQLARTVPNPRRLEKTEIPPKINGINNRILAFYKEWQKIRSERT